MNAINKIVKESGINFTGSALGNTLGYIWLIIMTRALSQEEFGSFTLAQSVINISLIFVLLGTHQSLDRFIPFYNASGKQGKIKALLGLVFKFVIISSLVVGLVLFAGTPFLGTRVFDNPIFTAIFPITILSLPLLALTMLVIFAFGGYKELRYNVYLKQLLEPGLKIAFALFLVVLGLGIVTWTWLYVAALFITAVISIWVLVSKIIRPLAQVERVEINIGEIISYSWPISISSIFVILVGQIDYLVLGLYDSAANIGIYRIYIQVVFLLKLVMSSMARIYKPAISELIPDQKMDEIREIYLRSAKWIVSLTTLGLLIIVLYGNPLTSLFFTDTYAIFPAALSILAFGTFLNSLFGLEGMSLEAFGNTRLILINSLVMLGVNTGMDFWLIPDYGIVGAAIASGCAMFLGGLMGFLEINYLYQMQPFSRDTLKFFVAGSCIGVLFYFLKNCLPDSNVFLGGLVLATATLYLAGLIALGGLDEVDREIIKKIYTRFFARK
jgi:O-antigen/teichoic acid export membrane protein